MEDQGHNHIQSYDPRKMQWRFLFKVLSGLITFVVVFTLGLWLLVNLKVIEKMSMAVIGGHILISYSISTIVMRSINRKR